MEADERIPFGVHKFKLLFQAVTTLYSLTLTTHPLSSCALLFGLQTHADSGPAAFYLLAATQHLCTEG